LQGESLVTGVLEQVKSQVVLRKRALLLSMDVATTDTMTTASDVVVGVVVSDVDAGGDGEQSAHDAGEMPGQGEGTQSSSGRESSGEEISSGLHDAVAMAISGIPLTREAGAAICTAQQQALATLQIASEQLDTFNRESIEEFEQRK
jgi:hypothetical protein